MNNKFSIIIPTLQKNKKYLHLLVNTLTKDESVGEIIIINNALQNLDFCNSKVRIIRPYENIFVNPAWNLGVAEAKFDNIGLFNDDVKIPDGFCSLVLPKLNKETGILGICEDDVINKKFSVDDYIELSPQISLREISYRLQDFGIIMFFKKSVFTKIPSDLKIFYGDDWLIFQAKKQKKKNYVIKGQKIYHYGQMSSNSLRDFINSDKKIYYKYVLNFWQKLFSVEETYSHRIIRFFGVLLSIKKENSKIKQKKHEMPRFSIITASYNYEYYIKETIESVIAQTNTDWEMIIVDDGSDDNSREVISKYCAKDKRIKLYTHPDNKNMGLSETIQLGVSKANSEWLIFLESDDIITPDYIEQKCEVLKKYPDVKFIFNDVKMFGDEDAIREYDQYFKKQQKILKNITFPANIVKKFKRHNMVPTFSCVMLKKEILEGLNWNSTDKRCLDWFLWTQIAYKNDLYHLPKELTLWRMHKTSYINRGQISKYQTAYFYKVQLADNITGGKFKIWHRLHYLYKITKVFIRGK